MGWENETLRFPTNLDRGAIVVRLIGIREMAAKAGVTELVTMLRDAEDMTAGKLGLAIVSAVGFVAGKPEYKPISDRLEMLAMNLKNLT